VDTGTCAPVTCSALRDLYRAPPQHFRSSQGVTIGWAEPARQPFFLSILFIRFAGSNSSISARVTFRGRRFYAQLAHTCSSLTKCCNIITGTCSLNYIDEQNMLTLLFAVDLIHSLEFWVLLSFYILRANIKAQYSARHHSATKQPSVYCNDNV
jgi:hypothetical protein